MTTCYNALQHLLGSKKQLSYILHAAIFFSVILPGQECSKRAVPESPTIRLLG